MEYGNNQIAASPANRLSTANSEHTDEFVCQRLDLLLQKNLEFAREKSLYATEREKLEAALMKNPVSIEKTFRRFGLMLGIFPPAALFAHFLMDGRFFQGGDVWFLGVLAIVNLISAVVGFSSGKFIGKLVFELEKGSWSRMLLTLPFIGIFWGMIAGGAAGIIIFGIGAFFGAMVGSLVGAAALPFFSIFHRLLKRGDEIENKHFLPLAFGVTFIISAFFLGL